MPFSALPQFPRAPPSPRSPLLLDLALDSILSPSTSLAHLCLTEASAQTAAPLQPVRVPAQPTPTFLPSQSPPSSFTAPPHTSCLPSQVQPALGATSGRSFHVGSGQPGGAELLRTPTKPSGFLHNRGLYSHEMEGPTFSPGKAAWSSSPEPSKYTFKWVLSKP